MQEREAERLLRDDALPPRDSGGIGAFDAAKDSAPSLFSLRLMNAVVKLDPWKGTDQWPSDK